MRKKVATTNISAITAISEDYGIIHVTFVTGSVTKEVYTLFSNEILQLFKEPTAFVMDNCKIHKGDDIYALFKSAGHEILYTAPNSPELNPIEYVFSIWKGRISIPVNVSSV